jgi:hypothetical protein
MALRVVHNEEIDMPLGLTKQTINGVPTYLATVHHRGRRIRRRFCGRRRCETQAETRRRAIAWLTLTRLKLGLPITTHRVVRHSPRTKRTRGARLGVYLLTRSDQEPRWVAALGHERTKSYSVAIYGARLAKRLAMQARAAWEATAYGEVLA